MSSDAYSDDATQLYCRRFSDGLSFEQAAKLCIKSNNFLIV